MGNVSCVCAEPGPRVVYDESLSVDEKRLRKIFESCDVDGSGDMTLDELELALKADANFATMYGLEPVLQDDSFEGVLRIFKEADSDNSGRVTWEEFYVEMVKQWKARKELSEFMTRTKSMGRRHSMPKTGHRKTQRAVDAWDMKALEMARANLKEWEIDYWALEPADEVILVMQAVTNTECFKELNCTGDSLALFVEAIKGSYRNNPYHNFQHALSTLHFSYKLLECGPGLDTLSSINTLALIIGALCHDCDHRGRNTQFEVLTRSELALTYNDLSPLENHHCATAFRLALVGTSSGSTAGRNIFEMMDGECFAEFRKMMIAAVLGTDMKFHSNHVNKLKPVKDEDQLHDHDLVEIIMHTADIANPLMPPDMSRRWGEFINQEFTEQSDEEAKLGLPISAFMVGLHDPKKAAQNAIGFADFVVGPLVSPLFTLFTDLAVVRTCFETNRMRQQARLHDSVDSEMHNISSVKNDVRPVNSKRK